MPTIAETSVLVDMTDRAPKKGNDLRRGVDDRAGVAAEFAMVSFRRSWVAELGPNEWPFSFMSATA